MSRDHCQNVPDEANGIEIERIFQTIKNKKFIAMTVFKVNNRPTNRTWNGLVNDLFADFENNFGTAGQNRSNSNVPVNITESENAYQLEVAAPGRNKESFSLNIENNTLTIGYEVKKETEKNELKQVRKELKVPYQSCGPRKVELDENRSPPWSSECNSAVARRKR